MMLGRNEFIHISGGKNIKGYYSFIFKDTQSYCWGLFQLGLHGPLQITVSENVLLV